MHIKRPQCPCSRLRHLASIQFVEHVRRDAALHASRWPMPLETQQEGEPSRYDASSVVKRKGREHVNCGARDVEALRQPEFVTRLQHFLQKHHPKDIHCRTVAPRKRHSLSCSAHCLPSATNVSHVDQTGAVHIALCRRGQSLPLATKKPRATCDAWPSVHDARTLCSNAVTPKVTKEARSIATLHVRCCAGLQDMQRVYCGPHLHDRLISATQECSSALQQLQKVLHGCRRRDDQCGRN